MSKIKNEVATRCELALMGKVVPCTTDEVQVMTEYILSAMGRENLEVDIVGERIQSYSKNEVKYIVTNRVMGMNTICYLLENGEDDEEYDYPKPFEEDYGSGYPCAFCYVLNVDYIDFSEFGDCFFEKKADGYYHRAS